MYAAAVFGNRILAFCNLLLLAYLLDPRHFGTYALIATNALVLQLVFGSWASTSISKQLATNREDKRGEIVSSAAAGILIVLAAYVLLVSAYAAFPIAEIDPVYVAVTLAWSLALTVYEIVLAADNALGRPKAYALLAMTRNSLAMALSSAAAWAGLGVVGAALGQVAGTLVPSLFLPSSLNMWRLVDLRLAAAPQLRKQVTFGLGGMIAFGLYALFSMTLRNMVGLFAGEVAAGQISLASDLFYVPLALVVNVLFLAKMPGLYVLSVSAEGGAERQRQLTTIVKGVAALAVPYMLAGFIIAEQAVNILLPGHVGEGVAPLAPAAAAFGGGFTILYATTMVLLIFEYRRWLAVTAAGVISCNMLLLSVAARTAPTPSVLLWTSAAVVLASAALIAWRLMREEGIAPTIGYWARLALANAAMIALILPFRSFGIVGLFAAALSGAAAYGLTLWRTGAFSPAELRSLRGVPEANT